MALNNYNATVESRGNTLKESVMDALTNLAGTETYLYDTLQTHTATQTIHGFNNFLSDLSNPGFGTTAEGAEMSNSLGQQAVRKTNMLQTITTGFNVTDEQEKSQNYGITSTYSFRKLEAMKLWKARAENSLLQATLITPDSGIGGQMRGLRSSLTTNLTSYASGTTITEEKIVSMAQQIYDAGIKIDNTVLLLSANAKAKISRLVTSVTKNIDADTYKQVSKIDIWVSTLGEIRLQDHRQIKVSSGGTGFMILMQPKAFGKAFLMEPFHRELPNNGAGPRGQIKGSLTLEDPEEKAGAISYNLVS